MQAASPPGSGQGGEKGAAAVGGKIGKLEQSNDDEEDNDDILSNKPSNIQTGWNFVLAKTGWIPGFNERKGVISLLSPCSSLWEVSSSM